MLGNLNMWHILIILGVLVLGALAVGMVVVVVILVVRTSQKKIHREAPPKRGVEPGLVEARSARRGERPLTSTEGPQTQLSQQSSPELWGRLVARTFALANVVEGQSQVSPASSRAVFLADMLRERAPETSLAPGRRLEPVHLHGVHDTSIHVCLPLIRGAELTELGWAEPHQYEDFGTEFLIYGPRTAKELDFVLSVIEESIRFARGSDVTS